MIEPHDIFSHGEFGPSLNNFDSTLFQGRVDTVKYYLGNQFSNDYNHYFTIVGYTANDSDVIKFVFDAEYRKDDKEYFKRMKEELSQRLLTLKLFTKNGVEQAVINYLGRYLRFYWLNDNSLIIFDYELPIGYEKFRQSVISLNLRTCEVKKYFFNKVKFDGEIIGSYLWFEQIIDSSGKNNLFYFINEDTLIKTGLNTQRMKLDQYIKDHLYPDSANIYRIKNYIIATTIKHKYEKIFKIVEDSILELIDLNKVFIGDNCRNENKLTFFKYPEPTNSVYDIKENDKYIYLMCTNACPYYVKNFLFNSMIDFSLFIIDKNTSKLIDIPKVIFSPNIEE